MHTFQAVGAMSRASSRLKMAWELNPCDWYRSASSHQASASVGIASSNSIKAEIASVGRSRERSKETLRLRMGYSGGQSFAIFDVQPLGPDTDHIYWTL